jgi:hypothetical protein
MQAMRELTGLFCLCQPLAINLILLAWNVLELIKLGLETWCREQNLSLAKSLEVTRRRAPANPPLMTPQSPKQTFQFQIILRQT